ncbi:hypothetical protein DL98DRAFT_541360 [Cadophora sp. DSE1049]|nr:hypothetical protein DL98DRAFT_541360 [Cadophora sp. DSE1049]
MCLSSASTFLPHTKEPHLGTSPNSSMQLKTLFLSLGTFTAGFCRISPIIQADALPCVPSNDPSTCLLNYEIRSGAALDLVDPEVSASAFIYSNACLQLGHKEVTVPGETPILSWGLSFSNPLVLGSEKRPDINWWTPWFAYGGRRYAYEDCACQGVGIDMREWMRDAIANASTFDIQKHTDVDGMNRNILDKPNDGSSIALWAGENSLRQKWK